MTARLLWADSPDGKMVHVTDAARGLHDLTCPECNRAVLAKQGDVRSWHFAHHNDDICSQTAPETALHKASKRVLRSLGAINMGASLTGPAAYIPFEFLGEEVRVGTYIVDAMIRNPSGDIAVEFVVTHPCTKEKILGLRALEQAAIEIFVGDRMFSDAHDLAVAISGAAPRKWLCFPTYEGRRFGDVP